MTDSPQHPPFPQQQPHYQSPPPHAYGAQGYPGPAPASSAPRSGNTMGLVAIIAGVLILVMQVVGMIGQAAVIRGTDYAAIQVVNVVQGVVQGVLGLVAVVFGIIGVVQKDKPKALAGIGLGIGLSALIGVITGWLIFPLIAAF